jgi:hypothetical protein
MLERGLTFSGLTEHSRNTIYDANQFRDQGIGEMTPILFLGGCVEINRRFCIVELSEGVGYEDNADHREHLSLASFIQCDLQQQHICVLVKRSPRKIRHNRAVANGSIHLTLMNSDRVR